MTKRNGPTFSTGLFLLTAVLITASPCRDEMTLAAAASDRPAPSTCSYALSRTDDSFSSAGGKGEVVVTAPGGCPWKAVSHAPSWITVTSGSSGAGNGTVVYRVAPNGGISRRGTVIVAGRTVTLHQTAAPCCDPSP